MVLKLNSWQEIDLLQEKQPSLGSRADSILMQWQVSSYVEHSRGERCVHMCYGLHNCTIVFPISSVIICFVFSDPTQVDYTWKYGLILQLCKLSTAMADHKCIHIDKRLESILSPSVHY